MTKEKISDMTDAEYRPLGLLEGKVAVVTGAGQGIGKVVARLFRDEGARVVVADFSGAQDKVAADLGSDAIPFQIDVRDETQIEAMFAQTIQAFGGVDVSVHVAGNPGGRRGEEVTAEEYEAITDTHLRGMMFCCKHAVRAMIARGGGSIVNFSSAASFNFAPFNGIPYSAAKAGINSMTKAFAGQYGDRNIRVNAIAPGFTLSDKNQTIPEAALAMLSQKAALGRGGTSEEQASVALFLASRLSSFVSGVTIPVDGGWTARLA